MRNNFIKHFAIFLSAYLVAFTSVYIVLITFCDIPEENMPFVNTVLGFLLGTVVGTVVTYYLGSSKSSADKTHILNGQEHTKIEPEV
jgi:hypothetical protein